VVVPVVASSLGMPFDIATTGCAVISEASEENGKGANLYGKHA
jgi:hypothetical protein